jgi:hypothetical protein
MFSGGNGSFHLHWTKAGRRRQQYDVDVRLEQLIHGVESGETLFIRDCILFPKRSLEVSFRTVEPVVSDFCNGSQTATRVGIHRIFGRTCSATAGTNKPDFDNVRALGVNRSIEKASAQADCGSGG